MNGAAESKHLEFHVDRSGDQNVVLDLFSRVLFVFLDQAHSDVGKQIVLQSVEFKFEHFADPIVIMFIYWNRPLFCLLGLGTEIKPDPETESIVLVVLQGETIAREKEAI